jgi:hypothetical protein
MFKGYMVETPPTNTHGSGATAGRGVNVDATVIDRTKHHPFASGALKSSRRSSFQAAPLVRNYEIELPGS